MALTSKSKYDFNAVRQVALKISFFIGALNSYPLSIVIFLTLDVIDDLISRCIV
jgi:hypothetical protein